MGTRGKDKLTSEARKLAGKYTANFSQRLKSIAADLADDSEKILERDVEHSYHTIRRRGITRPPWYWRREFLTLIGGILVSGSGLVFAVACMFVPYEGSGLPKNSWHLWILVVGLPVLMLIAGIVSSVLGFVKD